MSQTGSRVVNGIDLLDFVMIVIRLNVYHFCWSNWLWDAQLNECAPRQA